MKRLMTLFTVLMLSVATLTQVSASPFQKKAPMTKKDGTPDKRFKAKEAPKGPLKKDGTPDKRFKTNKPAKKN